MGRRRTTQRASQRFSSARPLLLPPPWRMHVGLSPTSGSVCSPHRSPIVARCYDLSRVEPRALRCAQAMQLRAACARPRSIPWPLALAPVPARVFKARRTPFPPPRRPARIRKPRHCSGRCCSLVSILRSRPARRLPASQWLAPPAISSCWPHACAARADSPVNARVDVYARLGLRCHVTAQAPTSSTNARCAADALSRNPALDLAL
ncbi:hypothetical protein B0H15DRAFT_539505 [Mycena belliarum]|uniref:Uncharacterized protein n=1 Tax=Mycena belliarum TaxID=1033014 RepID=A0AAD6XGW1_9AGAR|nr:hypothetical protein B0H15DRAFT_539505 [Mycena belliae]